MEISSTFQPRRGSFMSWLSTLGPYTMCAGGRWNNLLWTPLAGGSCSHSGTSSKDAPTNHEHCDSVPPGSSYTLADPRNSSGERIRGRFFVMGMWYPDGYSSLTTNRGAGSSVYPYSFITKPTRREGRWLINPSLHAQKTYQVITIFTLSQQYALLVWEL